MDKQIMCDLLAILTPQGGYYTQGDNKEDIVYLECQPITNAEWASALANYETLKEEKASQLAAAKASAEAKLAALGLTADDLKALGL
jgi:hypothetical protein